MTTISATRIKGMPVRNYKNEHLGRIEDVMINVNNATIAYVVLSYGGIFGTSLADKRFAVPFDALLIEDTDEEEVVYRLDIDKDALEKAPRFDKDNYPDVDDEKFAQWIEEYYAYLPRRVA